MIRPSKEKAECCRLWPQETWQGSVKGGVSLAEQSSRVSHNSDPGISDGTPVSDKPPSALCTPEQGALPHGACQIASVKHPPLPDLLSSPPIRKFSSIPSNPILDEDFFPVTRPAMTISHLDKVPLSHDHCRHLPHLPPWIATLGLLAVLLLPPCWWPTGSLLGMQLSWQNPCQACRKSWAQVPSIAQTRHGRTCLKLELQSHPTLLSSIKVSLEKR